MILVAGPAARALGAQAPRTRFDWVEVTAAQYRRCVEAGDCSAPGCAAPGDEHPAACVTWFQARDFAR